MYINPENFVEPTCAKHERDFDAFDSLPAPARAAFRDSLENWCVQCVTEGLKNTAFARNRIRVMDKGELWERRFDRMQARGPYSGNAPVLMDRLLEVDREWNYPTPGRKRKSRN